MKVILIKDVRKIGKKGEVVDVAEGYGRNFLISKGFGRVASVADLKSIKNKLVAKEDNKSNKMAVELELLGKINKSSFEIKANANKEGHLFAAVHKKDIEKIIGVDEKNIFLDGEIKGLGDFEVKIVLGGKKGLVNIRIVPT